VLIVNKGGGWSREEVEEREGEKGGESGEEFGGVG
jgi:hypothetical protein